ncbi:MAG TPA: hypothetical protein VFE45_17565, partial [Coriobacteriia bacterium]|nr:hypothetical protein [Coriobacteriia bacterium]
AGDASEAAAVTQPEPAVDASSEAAALAQDDDPDVAFDATEPVRAPDEPESPGAEDVKEDGGTA